MATFVETDVVVRVTIERSGGATRVLAEYYSVTSDGTMVRKGSRDITDQLSAARQSGANDLLNDITTRVKNLWEI